MCRNTYMPAIRRSFFATHVATQLGNDTLEHHSPSLPQGAISINVIHMHALRYKLLESFARLILQIHSCRAHTFRSALVPRPRPVPFCFCTALAYIDPAKRRLPTLRL